MSETAIAERSFYQPPADTMQPLVEMVPQMAEDERIRTKAAHFIGTCIASTEVDVTNLETNLAVQPIESLHQAIQRAAEGDPVARRMVETNVRTDVIERTIKAGHVIKVDLHVDETGQILQHGQSMQSVQANSLRYAADSPQMLARTKAEALNAFRIEEFYRQGKLQEYSFVVFSRAADDMSLTDMQAAGFFTDTMSCAIQVTTATSGRLTTESAFVAGISQLGGERRDAAAVAGAGAEFGADLAGQTATETLGTPILIHNSLIPNGAIDVVQVWDNQLSTFFGEDRPAEDYLAYRQKCLEREQLLQPKVDSIVEELLSEAENIHSPLEAVKRLHKLSEKHMVEQAAFDTEINPLVFGAKAAAHIEAARLAFAQGKYDQGLQAVSQAKATARSSSCPAALKSALAGDDMASGEDDKKESNEDCEFVSRQCPMCGQKNVKTKVKGLSSGKKRISGSCGCAITK